MLVINILNYIVFFVFLVINQKLSVRQRGADAKKVVVYVVPRCARCLISVKQRGADVDGHAKARHYNADAI